MALASLALGISERLDYFVTNTLGQQGNTFSWQKQIHFICIESENPHEWWWWWQWPLSQCGNRSGRLDYWSADLLNGCGRQHNPCYQLGLILRVDHETQEGGWWWWSTDLENIVNSLLAARSALVERGGNNLKFKVRTWEGVNLGTRRMKRGMWSLLWRWASAHLEANFQLQRLVEGGRFLCDWTGS